MAGAGFRVRCLLVVLAALVVCPAMAKVRPAVERVDAIVGQELVLPLAFDDVRDLERGFEVRLDDASRPPVEVFRLTPAPGVDGGWVGVVPRWRGEALRDARRTDTPGVWYAVIDLPLGAVSQGLWIDGERHEVNWLPDPERAALEAQGKPLWVSPLPAGAWDAPMVARAMDAVAGDPFQSWRVRLARDGLTPTGGVDRTGRDGTSLDDVRADLAVDPGSRFLSALAHHHEARWQLILGRLALIDVETADRMRRRLAGVARIDGAWAPMWAGDSPDLRALQGDLLSPWVDDATRVLRAKAWLDAQPQGCAWVIDDAGDSGGDGSRLHATLGVLSLPARLAPLLVDVSGARGAPVLETAPPQETIRLSANVPTLEPRGRTMALRTNDVSVRLGRSELSAAALATVPGVRPPGLRVGPLLRGWTMGSLLDGSPALDALPDPAAVATGVVRRVAHPGEHDDRVGWSVYLSCAGGGDATDSVTVWTGPFALPRQVWQVRRDGSVFRLFGGGDLQVRVTETETGWALDARLPPGAVDDDGVLRLGLVRQRGDERTSWPRRMTPGQDEPGRIALDVTAWRGL